jgi:hypothetical protein
MYYQTKNAITLEFLFERKAVIPYITNVNAAYLGILSAKDFLKIITDEDDNLIDSLFTKTFEDGKVITRLIKK